MYKELSSSDNTVKSMFHTHTKRVPDLEQFRRYFVTLLIHNLDSQVAKYNNDTGIETRTIID